MFRVSIDTRSAPLVGFGPTTVPAANLFPVTSPPMPDPDAPRGLLRYLRPSVPLERREIGILALFAVVTFTQGWTGTVITHALPFVRDTFDLDDGSVFRLLSTVRAVALIGLMFSWWGDHRGRRVPLLSAFFLLGIFNLLTAFAPNYTAFLWLQAVARIGGAALAALTVVMLAEELNAGVRSYGLGIAALFTGTGHRTRPHPSVAWRWRQRGVAHPVRPQCAPPAAPPIAGHLAEGEPGLPPSAIPPTSLRGVP